VRTYKQTVRFEREFIIQARDAEAANAQLDEMVDRVVFDADVESQGHYAFEDEPVECPACKGNGEVDEKPGEPCERCKGEGSIPFVAE
jgi:RecJ-like exonuclease